MINTFENYISVHPYYKMLKYIPHLEYKYYFLCSSRKSGAEQGAWVISPKTVLQSNSLQPDKQQPNKQQIAGL